jgi:chromosome segregation ATPase
MPKWADCDRNSNRPKRGFQTLSDQLQIKSYQEERSKAELRQLSRDVFDRNSEVGDLRTSLEHKKREIESLEIENRQNSLKIQELSYETEQSFSYRTADELTSASTAISLLMGDCEKQSKELSSLRGFQSRSSQIIAKQSRVIDELTERISSLEQHCRRLEVDREEVSTTKP